METQLLPALLRANPYPGRGILLGRSADGQSAVAAYFIMGRSENSRNRVFVETEDGIRTQAHDPSRMTDPSLIIYHPVRQVGRGLVVTNGDQTDTIRDYLLAGRTFAEALRSREFEPDAPNYTPSCCLRHFYLYDNPLPGEGRFLHTYQGDGTPLPSFEGEPVRTALTFPDPESLADELWEALHPENKVALFVRYIRLEDGTYQQVLRNKY